ncbi:uncharacterized protein, partial [Choristoneura fumiferana]|uniref:uncharacterized protein n=1 Tax=Choristoneura fumiferana TaxID=7141 RepID=UPI003D1593DF
NNSPFNRSGMTRRSPPSSPAPATGPAPAPRTPARPEDPLEVVSTSEIQNWMSSIEQCLNEVCAISSEGKLNSEQKLRISNLCRKVGHGTSQLAVQYQALKQKTLQFHKSLQVLEDNQDLSQQLLDLKKRIEKRIEESSKTTAGPVSFAEVIKRNAKTFIQPSNVSSVAIYPNDKKKTSEETKNLVQTLIRPEQLKLQVRGLHKTRNGGVIISTDTKADIEKLKQSAQLTSSGLTVDEPHKRKPRIVVVGVPSDMQDTEVYNCIFQQNLAGTFEGMTYETFISSIKLSHKSGKKEAETCNYVLEVTAQIRKALITKERVFVHWSSCPVRDFTLVTRCFKCQQYGHAAKSCRRETSTCGHCGETGHDIKLCTRKAEPSKCATCMFFKKPCGHKTGDSECPARLLAEKRYLNTIDYGGV